MLLYRHDCGTVLATKHLMTESENMRQAFYIMIICCMLATTGFAAEGGAEYDVEAEGIVCEDATWSGSVIVYGDVLVPEGVTLKIEPGANVYFSYTESSKIEPMFLSMQTELLVRGTLVCNGTKESPVTFLPAPESEDLKKPERGDWGGIIFDGGESSNSVIRGARLIMADIAFSTFYSSPEIAGCVMEDCEYGVYAAGDGTPAVNGCQIKGCEFGVVSHAPAKPVLTDMLYKDNAQDLLTR